MNFMADADTEPGRAGLWRGMAVRCAAVTRACGTGPADPEQPAAPVNTASTPMPDK